MTTWIPYSLAVSTLLYRYNNVHSFNVLQNKFCIVVGEYINTMKTTFDLNFELCKAVKHHENPETKKSREALT